MSLFYQSNHYDLLSNFNLPQMRHDELLPSSSACSIERKLYGGSIPRRESVSSESKGKNSFNLNGSFCKYRIFNLTSPYRDPY